MRRPPTPRPRIHDTYWRFAAERQRLFERRVAGDPPPWTDDPILGAYKFCNAFRAADRVSQYLIREVAYGGDACAPEERLFRILAFRFFSRPATWESLRATLGHDPTFADLRDGAFVAALDRAKAVDGRLYTGAFILCAADAFGLGAKHRNHAALFRAMFLRDGLGARILAAPSLAAVYGLLHAYPLIGDFMAYQIAIDLNYSALLSFSEDDFTQPGPGALRGLKKVFLDLGDFSPAEAIRWMVERQDEEFRRLGLPFRGLFGRPLHAIDCQGLFCETDKYLRVAAPELTSARTRIKTRFSPDATPLRLFFPPTWGLNDRLATEGGVP